MPESMEPHIAGGACVYDAAVGTVSESAGADTVLVQLSHCTQDCLATTTMSRLLQELLSRLQLHPVRHCVPQSVTCSLVMHILTPDVPSLEQQLHAWLPSCTVECPLHTCWSHKDRSGLEQAEAQLRHAKQACCSIACILQDSHCW